MENKKKIEEFLKELTELTKKYGFAIGGCGCCGSPYVYKLNEKQLDGEYKLDKANENLEYTLHN